MMSKSLQQKANAMPFYTDLVNSYKLAKLYGRIATLPEIMNARTEKTYQDPIWKTWFSTLSAEYIGIGQNGNLTLIVAHGIGPLSNLKGIKKAYSSKDRVISEGRISIEDFWRLERGEYGPVEIVDLEEYLSRRKYAFQVSLSFIEAIIDPIFKARVGKGYAKLIERCEENTKRSKNLIGIVKTGEFYRKYLSTYCVQLSCEVDYRNLEPGFATANLLDISDVFEVLGKECVSLEFTISYSSPTAGRFVGIKGKKPISDIFKINYKEALQDERIRGILTNATSPKKSQKDMTRILKIGNGMYYKSKAKKPGQSMDTGVFEHFVTSIKPIGELTEVTVEYDGSAFLEYDINIITGAAPKGANAYEIIDTKQDTRTTTIVVMFYKITHETGIVLSEKELYKNYNLVMKISALMQNNIS